MKALEKDRSRRYETANSFAADIERYLNNEAIEAVRRRPRIDFKNSLAKTVDWLPRSDRSWRFC